MFVYNNLRHFNVTGISWSRNSYVRAGSLLSHVLQHCLYPVSIEIITGIYL